MTDYKKIYSTLYKLTIISLVMLIFCFITTDEIYSQGRAERDNPPIKERLFYGGNFGLQFGSVTDIDISPVIGIWLLPRVNVAAGPKYRYYKDPYSDGTGIFGGRAYTEFMVLQDLNNIIPLGLNFGFFLHAEYEILSLESSFWKYNHESGRILRNTGLAGIGISQPIGRRSSINIMILWTLNDSFNDLMYDLYGSPEVRFSVIF